MEVRASTTLSTAHLNISTFLQPRHNPPTYDERIGLDPSVLPSGQNLDDSFLSDQDLTRQLVASSHSWNMDHNPVTHFRSSPLPATSVLSSHRSKNGQQLFSVDDSDSLLRTDISYRHPHSHARCSLRSKPVINPDSTVLYDQTGSGSLPRKIKCQVPFYLSAGNNPVKSNYV